MHRLRTSVVVVLLASAGGSGGCAEIRVEDRGEVDSSSAPGSGGGTASGDGGAGLDPSGPDPTSSAAGGGGDGGAEPLTPCETFTWGDPSSHPLIASEAPHVLGDLVIAPATVPGNPAEIAYTHVWEDHGWVLGRVACMRLAEHGLVECTREAIDVQTDVPPPIGFDAEGVPIVVSAEGPSNAQVLEVQPYPEDPLRRTVAADLRGARHLAVGPAGGIAVVHGPETLPELTVIAGTTATHVGRAACVEGAVPLALVGVETGFLVAHGDAPGACDAGGGAEPSVLVVERIEPSGARTALHELDLAGPVVDVAFVAASGGAWLAARVEDEDVAHLWRIEQDGALGPPRELPVTAGRGIALAPRGDGLVVLDTGPAVHDDAAARVRFLDASLTAVVTTVAPLVARPPLGTPVLHVADDGARIDAVWLDPRDESTRLVALGARCAAP